MTLAIYFAIPVAIGIVTYGVCTACGSSTEEPTSSLKQKILDAMPEWLCDLVGLVMYIGAWVASPFSARARKLL